MSYRADASPEECWQQLSSGRDAVLVDVRTQAEWAFVGMPLAASDTWPVIGQQWQVFPEMNVDAEFTSALSDQLENAGATKETHLYFLCRSGVRSMYAAKAMTAEGYINCYNVSGGFEGDADGEGHRGLINGWKASGLPWRQN